MAKDVWRQSFRFRHRPEWNGSLPCGLATNTERPEHYVVGQAECVFDTLALREPSETKRVYAPTARSRNTLPSSVFWCRDFSREVPTNERGIGRKRGNRVIWVVYGLGESRRGWRERVGWSASKPFACSGYTTRPTGLAGGPCLCLRVFRYGTLTGGGGNRTRVP